MSRSAADSMFHRQFPYLCHAMTQIMQKPDGSDSLVFVVPQPQQNTLRRAGGFIGVGKVSRSGGPGRDGLRRPTAQADPVPFSWLSRADRRDL